MKVSKAISKQDESFLKNIGKVIRLKRLKRSYSQRALSSRLSISQVELCRYEKGFTNMPVLSLKEIADVCDFKMDDLFIEVEPPCDMYKKIINKNKRRKYPKRSKEDDEFNTYLSRPENSDKATALYHAYKMSEVIHDEAKDRLIYTLQSVLPYGETDNAQLERLTMYMNLLTENSPANKG